MAKPKLALIPAAQGDKFYSVLPSDGVGDFDFTRNSSATRIAPTGFIQEVGAFGSELVTNGNFDNDSDWAKATGWSISGGKAIATAANNGADLVQNIGLVNGKSYKIEVTISGYVAGSLRMNFLGTGGNFGDFTANGTYIGYADGGNDSRLQIAATTTTTTLSIDNVSVKEVIGNKSRLDYDLLNGKVVNCPHYLLEPARTNLITYSEDIIVPTNWETVNLATVSNSITSPDGTLNGTKVIRNIAGTGSAWIRQRPTVVIGANQVISIFGKEGNKSILNITYYDTTTGDRFFNYNLSTSEITGNGLTNATYVDSGIENFGNGWYRCYAVVQAQNTSPQVQFSIGANRVNSEGDFIYVFGAQVESGSYPTSYIPTNGTAITRAAESATGSGNAATFNDSEGVLMFEGSFVNDTSFKGISISNGTIANNIRIYHSTTDNQLVFRVRVGDVDQVLKLYTLSDTSLYNKISFKYKENDFNVFINGFKLLTDTSGSTFASGILNQLNFNRGDGLDPFYGNTRELQYFDSALTDAQLETLTSWTSLQEMITSQLYTNY